MPPALPVRAVPGKRVTGLPPIRNIPVTELASPRSIRRPKRRAGAYRCAVTITGDETIVASTGSIYGYDDGDVDTNRTGTESLEAMVASRFSRRAAMRGGASTMAFAVFGGSMLAACDEGGSLASPNLLPTGSATTSGTASGGRVITLTGTATDPDGTIASQSFVQTAGPAVSIQNASTGAASFIAPAVSAPTTLTFQYSATDNGGLVATSTASVQVTPPQLGFTAVPKNRNDVVTVPEGYSVTVLYRTGDPIAAGVPAAKNDGTDTNYAQRAGDHHDAIHFFPLAATGNGRDPNNSERGLLMMNHENVTEQYLHVNGVTPGAVRLESEAIKEIEVHGLSVVEVVRAGRNGAWSYVQAGALNRRITPNTPMAINGPVRGTDFVRTPYSNDGIAGRGTINNCANGFTPWGTGLTCEENWAGYFRRPAADNAVRGAKAGVGLARFGVTSGSGNFGWSTVTSSTAGDTRFARWNATATPTGSATNDWRNEPNQYGWVVEIDPYDPASTPRKRTALGRMGHEGAWPGQFVAGRKPAWYMGDDSRGEYLYKFVSATPWVEADAQATDRLAIGDKYLDNGTLYVARFNADGSGQWLPLVFGQNGLNESNPAYGFTSQADVLVHTRLAADAVGATPMDRPEWTAVNPVTGEMYLTLTNSNASARPLNGTNAANPRHYNDPKQRPGAVDLDENAFTEQRGNPNGHIVRLREAGDNTESATFTWDIYLFGAGADLDRANINVSGLDATNDLSSPDGLWFGRPSNASGAVTPVLWIQTDDGAYTDVTNCMMLAAMPGTVGDGATRTITNRGANGATAQQATRVGKEPGAQLRRFLVGPVECEITGIDSTPDGRTIFVNIQHPGEGGSAARPTSNWPNSQAGAAPGVRPRSATIAVTKNDGGVVAL